MWTKKKDILNLYLELITVGTVMIQSSYPFQTTDLGCGKNNNKYVEQSQFITSKLKLYLISL